MMEIALLEPYHTGSHAAWGEEYARHSRHRVTIVSLPGRHWKWRMHGGAVTLARRFLALKLDPQLIVASDMLDLTTFLALTRHRTARCATAAYFHENQLTYPWSPADGDTEAARDLHYAFINYTTALAADGVFFNSAYHRQAFLGDLPRFLGGFPDETDATGAAEIEAKSSVLPLGLDLRRFERYRPAESRPGRPPLLLWNHRWEYDKNPEEFFTALFELAADGIPFRVAVVGEHFRRKPAIFAEARRRLGERVVQWGYVNDFAAYARWLWEADILPVTSQHDFFGGSVVQALFCGCRPLLPNRLAYPEHLPGTHPGHLYDEGDFATALRRVVMTHRDEAEVEGIRRHVARYDWRELAPVYDEAFAALAASRGAGG